MERKGKEDRRGRPAARERRQGEARRGEVEGRGGKLCAEAKATGGAEGEGRGRGRGWRERKGRALEETKGVFSSRRRIQMEREADFSLLVFIPASPTTYLPTYLPTFMSAVSED